jgi:hypothetical protein
MFDLVEYPRWVVIPHHATRSGEHHWQAKRLAAEESDYTDTEVGRANAERLAAETRERF